LKTLKPAEDSKYESNPLIAVPSLGPQRALIVMFRKTDSLNTHLGQLRMAAVPK
jgi:hypothetical protein